MLRKSGRKYNVKNVNFEIIFSHISFILDIRRKTNLKKHLFIVIPKNIMQRVINFFVLVIKLYTDFRFVAI